MTYLSVKSDKLIFSHGDFPEQGEAQPSLAIHASTLLHIYMYLLPGNAGHTN